MQLIAKTLQGLEEVLAEELRALGALNVEPGRRMVTFEGDKAMIYRANMALRTALRILKPIAVFEASDPDELYSLVKEIDWGEYLSPEKTFSVDPVVYSTEFTNSRFVTYRVKDAIVDWFQDRHGMGVRPGVRLKDASLQVNVHIAGRRVTVSLDSTGESLHHRGWRTGSSEAPLSEVLAAGILLKTGYRGDCPLVDPMCGSGTFLVEAALIATNTMPGIFRQSFAFEQWGDFDKELFEDIFNDDSAERVPPCPIVGADISRAAVATTVNNLKRAGMSRYVRVECKPLEDWKKLPDGVDQPGILVTNPPYGERLKVDDLTALYQQLGAKLKNIFKGWHAWVLSMSDDCFNAIGLAASSRFDVLNGALECQLREYVMFDGDYKSFRASGGSLATASKEEQARLEREKRQSRDRHFTAKGRSLKPRIKQPESENPLAKRRNVHALKSIAGKKPGLEASSEPVMRSRRKGWKAKEE